MARFGLMCGKMYREKGGRKGIKEEKRGVKKKQKSKIQKKQ